MSNFNKYEKSYWAYWVDKLNWSDEDILKKLEEFTAPDDVEIKKGILIELREYLKDYTPDNTKTTKKTPTEIDLFIRDKKNSELMKSINKETTIEEIIELLHSERFNAEKPLSVNCLEEYASDFKDSYLSLYDDAFNKAKERFFEDYVPCGNWYAGDMLDEDDEVIEEKAEEFLRSDDFLDSVQKQFQYYLENTVEKETNYDNPWGNSPYALWNINEESGRTELNSGGCLPALLMLPFMPLIILGNLYKFFKK